MWILSILSVFLFLFWFYKRTRAMSLLKRSGIPGPQPNLIFGNALQMKNMSIVDYQTELIRTYGRVVGYYTGIQPTILVADTELIKRIQNQDFKIFEPRPFVDFNAVVFEKGHNGSIFLTSGERWKTTRKLITPSFSPSKLKGMTSLIEKSVNTFIDIIGRYAETGDEINFHLLTKRMSAEVIMKTGFGIEVDIQINTKNQFFEDMQEFLSLPINFELYLLYHCFPWLFPLVYHIRRLGVFGRKCIFKLFDAISAIIKLKKDSSHRRNDILDSLIFSTLEDEGKGGDHLRLSEDEIKANVLHLCAAGFDTTSTTMAIVAHHLVNYPDVQEKVRKEVQELYGRVGILDFNGIFNGLEYLDCVLNETLRLYPPAPTFVSRICLEDYQYQDMLIPKGSRVSVPVHPINNDPEYWPNPEEFDPMRFSPENKHKIVPFSFQSFGSGPRNCIAQRFAFLEMKLLFSKLLLYYRLECGPNTEIGKLSTDLSKFGLHSLFPKHGVFVKAVKI